MRDITSGNLRKSVFILALPVVARMFLQMLVGLADLAMVGRISHQAISAVGLSNQVWFLAFSLITAFTVGTTALVARMVGAGKHREAEGYARQSLVLTLLTGLAIGLVGAVFARQIISIMMIGMAQPDPEIIRLGTIYLRIVAISAPLTFLMMTVTAILQGAGDMKAPLFIMAGCNVFNVVFDYLLIFGIGPFPALGVAGAAIATSGAHTLGGIAGLALMFSGRGAVQIRLRDDFRLQREKVKDILRIGIPSALEQLLRSSGQVVFTMLVAGLGSVALAANQIIMKAMSISFMPGFGFGLAATTLVGQNLGAGKPDRAEESGYEATRMAMVLMSLVGVMFFLASHQLAGVFTTDLAVKEAAGANLKLLAVSQPFLAVVMVLAGALRGAGDTKIVMWVTLVGTWGSRVVIAWLLGIYLGMGLTGIWLAMVIDNILRAVLLYARYRSGRWKALRVAKAELKTA